MAQVASHTCFSWQWDHNATTNDRGHILVCWHPKVYHFQVMQKTDQLIHGQATQLSTNKLFFVTFVYGHNHEADRKTLWDALISISNTMDDPWCILGDFNSVLHQGERMGGTTATEREMRDFGECIQHCGLQEFNTVG